MPHLDPENALEDVSKTFNETVCQTAHLETIPELAGVT